MAIKINKIIKILIAIMFSISIGDGIIAPMFSIFIIQRIEGADLTTVGYAVAVYWISKSILQFPVSRYLDRTKGENDDIFSIMTGIFIFGVVSLLFLFAKSKFDLFLLQGLLALGGALFIPPWYATFTRHVDKFEIGFEWSLNSGTLGVATAGAGALSGVLASKYGFNIIFIFSFITNIMAFLAALLLYKYMVRLNHREKVFPETIKNKM